jgi:hypothetical protein
LLLVWLELDYWVERTPRNPELAFRVESTVAATWPVFKATVGEALTTNWVALLMLLIIVLVAKVPVPELTTTGMPALKLAVLLTVTVVPLLLAPVNTGLLTPTINFTNTQAASLLLGPLLVRQLLSQLRSNSTMV